VADAVSGRRARVRRIVTMVGDLAQARQGHAVVLQLDSDIDVSRGGVLATPGREPQVARSLDVRLVWLSDEPFAPERGYLLRTATDVVPVSAIAIAAHLDLATLAERPAATCAANDIAVARIDLGRSAALDLFSQQRETGSFMLVDPVSGASVAGGVVTAARAPESKQRPGAFRLTREALARGIGADLPADTASEQELRRRANEVAILMRGAGVAVEIEDRWANAGIDPATIWLTLGAVLSFGLIAAVVLGMI
jgi:bifunctional enzyme CysN/CysC